MHDITLQKKKFTEMQIFQMRSQLLLKKCTAQFLIPGKNPSRQPRYSPVSTEHPQLLLYSFKELQ